jgi:hypothetical protein
VPADNNARACGCLEGQLGLLVALGAFGALVLFARASLPSGGWGLTAAGFAFGMGGAVVGKAAGMLRVRRQGVPH